MNAPTLAEARATEAVRTARRAAAEVFEQLIAAATEFEALGDDRRAREVRRAAELTRLTGIRIDSLAQWLAPKDPDE